MHLIAPWRLVFRDPYRHKLKQECWIAVEGLHTGQVLYCGAKAKLDVGSVFLLAMMPDISLVGCMIAGHSDDGKKTYVGIKDSHLKFDLNFMNPQVFTTEATHSMGKASCGVKFKRSVLKGGALPLWTVSASSWPRLASLEARLVP
jgi:hypothetical protein